MGFMDLWVCTDLSAWLEMGQLFKNGSIWKKCQSGKRLDNLKTKKVHQAEADGLIIIVKEQT